MEMKVLHKKARWTKSFKKFITNVFTISDICYNKVNMQIQLNLQRGRRRDPKKWNISMLQVRSKEKPRARGPLTAISMCFWSVTVKTHQLDDGQENRPDSEKDDDVKQSLKVPHRSCWLRRRHTKETNWLKSEPKKNSLLAGTIYNSKVQEAAEAAQTPEIRPQIFLVCLRTNQPTADVSAGRIRRLHWF